MDPHTPLTPPLTYIERNDKEAKELRDFGLNKTIGHNEKNFNIKNKDTLVNLYAAEVRYVDHSFKSVLETFDDFDVWDDTLIILTADHGEEHFEHGKYGHRRTLYDETTAVPLIIHFPDRKTGSIKTPSSVIDIPTTILSYVGSDKTGLTEGNNLCEYINEYGFDGERNIYEDRTDRDLEACSIRSTEFLLIHYTLDIEDTDIEEDSWELYRYKQDPYQEDNIIALFPDEADELRANLMGFKTDLYSKAPEIEHHNKLEFSSDDKELLRELGYF